MYADNSILTQYCSGWKLPGSSEAFQAIVLVQKYAQRRLSRAHESTTPENVRFCRTVRVDNGGSTFDWYIYKYICDSRLSLRQRIAGRLIFTSVGATKMHHRYYVFKFSWYSIPTRESNEYSHFIKVFPTWITKQYLQYYRTYRIIHSIGNLQGVRGLLRPCVFHSKRRNLILLSNFFRIESHKYFTLSRPIVFSFPYGLRRTYRHLWKTKEK